MTIVIDPSKDGLEKVLRDYQIEALSHVWEHDGAGLTSREVYEAVNESLNGGRSVSRASIINFLNAMCDEGVLDFEEETCKGGMRRRYRKGMDEAAFKKYVASTVLRSLMKDFPEQTLEAIKSNLDAGSLERLHD
jgi:predicted transcriptional regulator